MYPLLSRLRFTKKIDQKRKRELSSTTTQIHPRTFREAIWTQGSLVYDIQPATAATITHLLKSVCSKKKKGNNSNKNP